MSADTVVQALILSSLAYLGLVYTSHLARAVAGAVDKAMRRSEPRAQDATTLATSRFTIPVSIVLTACDEERAIGEAVRSLLDQEYPELEVIVVDDGSRDGTLRRLCADFELEQVELFPRKVIETAAVRAYYRCPHRPRLTVVDKARGGKADALNAGINLARFRYVCGVEVETALAPDALLRGMRRVMSDPASIVGVTAHLAIADDRRLAVHGPGGNRPIARGSLAAFQHADSLRASLDDRLASARLHFTLGAVGALRIWRRDVLEELGGFATGESCEDIELTVRLHERFRREGRPFRVLCLPDSVGVTTGPDTVRGLVAQRERRQRVILETLWSHRRMCLNPRYGRGGMLGVPYCVLSQALAPVFALLALGALAAGVARGLLDWRLLALTTLAVALVNASTTAAAVFQDDYRARTYSRRALAWLLVLAPLELVLYRPIVAWARVRGIWRFLRGDRGRHTFELNRPTPAPSRGA